MAKSVAFGAHLKRPAKPGQAWKKKIKVAVLDDGRKKRKVYTVQGVDGWFMRANAKRAAKGLSTHRKENSVRAKFRRGEISAAEAKAKLGRAPRKRK